MNATQHNTTFFAYLQLVRLPNVFSALADIVTGYFIAAYKFGMPEIPPSPHIYWAALSSAALYLSGMAFNDIADREEDALYKRGRPIAKGSVSMAGAMVCGTALMVAGILIAWCAGQASAICAIVIAGAILSYDFICKKPAAQKIFGLPGPVALGICRSGNILLGMSAAPGFMELLNRGPLTEFPGSAVLASGLYGAGVTAFSAQEETGKKTGAMVLGWVFAAAGFVAAAATGFNAMKSHGLSWNLLGMAVLGWLVWQIVSRSITLIKAGTPGAARGLVLAGVKGYCPLDAAMLILAGGLGLMVPAVVVLALLLPGGWMRKWLSQYEA